ncbi:MAG: tetratricopeptide repeat protein [Myxococcaceae bacterium]
MNDDEFLAQLYKGGELLAAGKVDEAKSHLEKAHELRPKNEKAQNLLGLTYFKLGQFPQAAEIYEALVRENPVDPTLRVNLGLVYLKTNLLEKSVKEFETATDLQPDHKKAHNYLGLALAQANDYARAREHFLIAGSEAMADKMAKAMVSAEPPTLGMRATMEMPAIIVPPPPPAVSEPPPEVKALPRDEPLASDPSQHEPPHMLRTREARPMEAVEPPPDARPSRPTEDAEIEVMSDEDVVPPESEEAPSGVTEIPRPTYKPPTPPEPLSTDWGAQFGIDTPPSDDEMPVLEATPVVEATVEEVIEVEQGLPVAQAEAPAWDSSGPVDEALSQQQLPSWVNEPAPTNGNGNGTNGNGHSVEGVDPTGGWSAVPPSDDILMARAQGLQPGETLEPESSPPVYLTDPADEGGMVVTAGDPYASQPVPVTTPEQVASGAPGSADEMDFSSVGSEGSKPPAVAPAVEEAAPEPSAIEETPVEDSPMTVTEGAATAINPPAPEYAAEMTYRPRTTEFDGEETYVPKHEEPAPVEAPKPDPFAGVGVEMSESPIDPAASLDSMTTPDALPAATVDPDSLPYDPVAADGEGALATGEELPAELPPAMVPVETFETSSVDGSDDSYPPPVSSAPRPGYAPVEVPKLVDLGPSLDYGQSPKAGPFHIGAEGLALSVEGELLSRLQGVVAVVGSVDAQPERRRFRGRASEEAFGEGAGQMQRLSGYGVVYLESTGGEFQAIDLDDEGVYLREERIFAFEEVVAFENGKLTGENITVPLVNLKGRGRVLLKLDGPLKAIAVPPGTPLKVPLNRLVGWYGRVSPKVIGFVGQKALELTGDGYALLARG